MPKGEGNQFRLATVRLPQNMPLTKAGEQVCTVCDLRKSFKVTVAVFDYSLLVIDQGGNVLIGKAPE